MDLDLEISKTKAVLDALIVAEKTSSDVDVLGMLLVIRDQLSRIEEASENH